MSVRALPSDEISEQGLKAKKDALKGLKVAQLASYDDFLTDVLVDKVYYWSKIRKNRERYSSSRKIKGEDIPKLLQDALVLDKDVTKAYEKLLKFPGVQDYYERLSEEEQEHFGRHMRKYLHLYLPDCPFEVSTTNRYQISEQEASIAARKRIRKGDPVKYLVGIQVPITKDEEKDLDLTRRDFSIVMSSRKRLPSLFLGPARFANHDCKPNARLTTKGPNGMAVVAAKDIEVGDEIVVSYGDDYFGIGNRECLCYTCETNRENGWRPKSLKADGTTDSEDAEDESDDEPKEVTTVRRSRTTSRSASASSSRNHTPDGPRQSPLKRKRDDMSRVNSPRNPRHEELRVPSFTHSPSRLRHEVVISDDDGDEEMPDLKDEDNIECEASNRSESAPSVFERRNEGSEGSTSATSVSDHPTEAQSKEADVPMDDEVTTANIWNMPVDPRPNRVRATDDSPNSSQASSQPQTDDEEPTVVVEDADEEGPPRKKKKIRVSEVKTRSSKNRRSGSLTSGVIDPQDDYETRSGRKPRDYVLTRRLLATPFSRWNHCRVCKEHFVQTDAYQTRWACKRCERHSMLYGFSWPKTEFNGPHDRTTRHLDPRTINRFVHGEEERVIKKGKKTVDDLQKADQERRARRERGEGTDEEAVVNFGAKPGQEDEDEWSTDDEGMRRNSGWRKPQKRDYNPDGSLRPKRQYNWSGKYVGRWNKVHSKPEDNKFGGLHPATAQAKKAAKASGVSAKRFKELSAGEGSKRPYKRSGKYVGRLAMRMLKKYRAGEITKDELPGNVYLYENLPYCALPNAHLAGTEASHEDGRKTKSKMEKQKARESEKPGELHLSSSSKGKAVKVEKPKKKAPWKGWAVVDENGNEVSPPSTPKVKVPRWHPEIKDHTRLDIKPEHANKIKEKKKAKVPAQKAQERQKQQKQEQQPQRKIAQRGVKTNADDSITSTTHAGTSQSLPGRITKTAPKRVKGWVYLDADGNPLDDVKTAPSSKAVTGVTKTEEPAEDTRRRRSAFASTTSKDAKPAGRTRRARASTGKTTVEDRPRRQSAQRRSYVDLEPDEWEDAEDAEDDNDENNQQDAEQSEASSDFVADSEDEAPIRPGRAASERRASGRASAGRARRRIIEDSDDDDEDEEEGEEDEEEEEDEPAFSPPKRKYVRTGKYAGRASRQKAQREAASAPQLGSRPAPRGRDRIVFSEASSSPEAERTWHDAGTSIYEVPDSQQSTPRKSPRKTEPKNYLPVVKVEEDDSDDAMLGTFGMLKKRGGRPLAFRKGGVRRTL